MSFILWLVFSFIGLVVALWISSLIKKPVCERWKRRFHHSLDDNIVFLATAFFVVTPVLLSPLYYEFPNWGSSQVVTFDGDKITHHPWGVFSVGKRYANVPTGSVTYLRSAVTFITENPKIRTVHYGATAEISNLEQYYKKAYRKNIESAGFPNVHNEKAPANLSPDTVRQDVTMLLASAEAEFNETHSRDLAKFWNQFSREQQEEFKEFTETWFNAKLSLDGIRVVISEFTIY